MTSTYTVTVRPDRGYLTVYAVEVGGAGEMFSVNFENGGLEAALKLAAREITKDIAQKEEKCTE
jgi:hypothetical protein